MKDLLLQACTYIAINGALTPCQTTLPLAYNQSSIKPSIDSAQAYIEHKSRDIFETIPYSHTIGAISSIVYKINQRDFRIPLTSHIEAGYYNQKAECNLQWSF